MNTKMISEKQLAANRKNAALSTGPRSVAGKAASRMNALKQGARASQVVVRGWNVEESARDFAALRQRFVKELKPEGPLEELLVEQIVTSQWRLRRVLKAEAAEIALSVDNGKRERDLQRSPDAERLRWELGGDRVKAMKESSRGNAVIEVRLREAVESVEVEGELTEEALEELGKLFGAQSYLVRRVWELWSKPRLEGVSEEDWREDRAELVMDFLNDRLSEAQGRRAECTEREQAEEAARQAASVLPDVKVVDKIMKYEAALEREMYRAMELLNKVRGKRCGGRRRAVSHRGQRKQRLKAKC